MKLTAKTVGALKLPHGKHDAIYFCDDLPGFGYRLRASGDRVRRSWVAQYRNFGRTRRVLLGPAELLNVEQARAAAKKVLARATLGHDPQAEKVARRQKDTHSLKGVVGDYLAFKQRTVRPRTYGEVVRYLTGHFFKPLHNAPIDQITRKDVAARLTKITLENGSITASRARIALSGFYVWAMGQGLAESNPVIGTTQPQEGKPRDRVLDDGELAAIWRAAGDDAYGKVIKLLILTGCRRQEVGGMRWSELDLEKGSWSLPPERTKNSRAHMLPLMPLALKIIQSVPERGARDHLFGSRSSGGFSDWGHARADLDQHLGATVRPWRLHDLRRTCATRLCDLGVAPHVVEQLLNHVSGHKGGVAGIYNRSSYANEVKAALALWADHVHAITERTKPKVISMNRQVP
jgi:integrase